LLSATEPLFDLHFNYIGLFSRIKAADAFLQTQRARASERGTIQRLEGVQTPGLHMAHRVHDVKHAERGTGADIRAESVSNTVTLMQLQSEAATAEKKIGVGTMGDGAIMRAQHLQLLVIRVDIVSQHRPRGQESGGLIDAGVMRSFRKQLADAGDFSDRLVAMRLDIGVMPASQLRRSDEQPRRACQCEAWCDGIPEP